MILDTVAENALELSTHCQNVYTILRILENFKQQDDTGAIFEQLVHQEPLWDELCAWRHLTLS